MDKEKVIYVAHIADSHLRYSQYGLTERGYDFFRSLGLGLSNISNWRSKSGEAVELVLHGGDLADSRKLYARQSQQLDQLHTQLKSLGLPMLTIPGNHDASEDQEDNWLSKYTEGSSGEQLPPGIVEISRRRIVTLSNGVTICGVGNPTYRWLRNNMGELPDADIYLWHGAVQEFCGFPTAAAVSIEELKKAKAWLLGDIHVASYMKRNDDTLVGYPGSTEMCNSGEPLDKSATILAVSAEGVKIVDRVRIPTRKFFTGVIKDAEQWNEAFTQVENYWNASENKTTPYVAFSVQIDIYAEAERSLTKLLGDTPYLDLRPFKEVADLRLDTQEEDTEDKLLDYNHFLGKRLRAYDTVVADMAIKLADTQVSVGEAQDIIDKTVEELLCK